MKRIFPYDYIQVVKKDFISTEFRNTSTAARQFKTRFN